ncbi:MAG TPA: AarF/UbiB family protein [Gemmatimonadaceae bacterium]|nr:AarF/UbiB family protein [Gemmatimonadaceae bacterium]
MRLVVIALRLGPLILSFRRDWVRWIFFGPPSARSEAFHRRRAERIVRTLAALGPTFIKMAQLIGSRTDVFPEPYVGALATLMDRVPATPWPRIERELVESYGRPVDAVFDRMERVPLASASIGQVHEAWVGGQHVAVKILRPGVERLIAADVAACRRLLDVVEWLFDTNARVRRAIRQYRAVMEEFAYRVKEEIDYRTEAAHAIEIRENFEGSPGIRVPAVMQRLVRERVLVMEFMDGDPLDALESRVASGDIDVTTLVRQLIEAYTSMMMVDGLFQADPHPRNLKVAPDGALVLLDFGMVVRVSRGMRKALLGTILSTIRKDADGVVNGFEALGLLAPEATREQLRVLVEALLDVAARNTTTLERMELLSNRIMGNLYESPVSLPSSMVYFARTAALIEGIGTRYDPLFNPVKVASPVVIRLQPRIVGALTRTHTVSAADWAASVTSVVGDGLDAVSTRFGLTEPGVLTRLSVRLAEQIRSALTPPARNGRQNGRPGRHE